MVQHIKPPGNDRDEPTGLHTPESLRKGEKKAPDSSKTQKSLDAPEGFVPKAHVEEPPHIKTVLRFIDFHELVKLKKYLQEKGGDVAAVSSETKKKIGKINTFKHVWSSDDLKNLLVELVRNDDYAGALQFIENNEQYIMETWVDDYLEQKRYQEAASTLRDFEKIRPSKRIDEKQIQLEVEIDKEILGAMEEDLNEENLPKFNPAHDRVWSLVHHGCYAQAAELCDQLNVQEYSGETLEEAREKHGKKVRDKVPSPMVFEEEQEEEKTLVRELKETPAEIEKRHEAEVMHALPKTAEEMKKVFPDLNDLLAHFHHQAQSNENAGAFMSLLKETYRLYASRLFDQGKVVFEQKGFIPAEEEFLGLVDDLGYLGYHLYINKKNRGEELYLLEPHEADSEYYSPVDLKNLEARDIILDKQNFKEKSISIGEISDEAVTTVKSTPEEEKTPVSVAPRKGYAWVSNVVRIQPETARKLRRAA